MSKTIKVTDEIYARLEEQAKRGYRPITSHLEFLLDYFEAGEKNKTENPEKIVSPAAKNQRPNGEHRMVATGDRAMPVRESLPDELEEALYHYKQISEDLKPEALMAWCHKQSVEEAWTDEQAKIEVDKRREELLAEREEVAAILKEHNVNIGI
jgi:hypothetical protein